jgi:hypothetical protein
MLLAKQGNTEETDPLFLVCLCYKQRKGKKAHEEVTFFCEGSLKRARKSSGQTKG